MKLIQIKHRYDFGHDLYVQVLSTGKHLPKLFKNRSLVQLSVSWNDYPSWPYVQISSGNNGLLSIIFWAYKFGFDVDVLSRTWNWNYLEESNDGDV